MKCEQENGGNIFNDTLERNRTYKILNFTP